MFTPGQTISATFNLPAGLTPAKDVGRSLLWLWGQH